MPDGTHGRGPRKKVTLDHQLLRAARQNEKMTIEEVVGASGGRISESTYKRAERGIEISILKADEIAALFGKKLEDFLPKMALPESSDEKRRPEGSSRLPPFQGAAAGLTQLSQETLLRRVEDIHALIAKYSESVRSVHGVELAVNDQAVMSACHNYFMRNVRYRQNLHMPGVRTNALTIGALTCYSLAQHRPITIVNFHGDTSMSYMLSEHVNEMMAIAIGSALAGIAISVANIYPLIAMLTDRIGESNFLRAFELLAPD